MPKIPVDANDLFSTMLPEAIAKDVKRAKAVGGRFLFAISGASDWLVDLDEAKVAVALNQGGPGPGVVGCTVSMSAENFKAMIDDPQKGIEFYRSGRMQISGEPESIGKLQSLFALIA